MTALSTLIENMTVNGHIGRDESLYSQDFRMKGCIKSTMVNLKSVSLLLQGTQHIDWVTTLLVNPALYPKYKKHGKVLFNLNGKTYLLSPKKARLLVRKWIASQGDKKVPVLSRLWFPATTLLEFYNLYTAHRLVIRQSQLAKHISLVAA